MDVLYIPQLDEIGSGGEGEGGLLRPHGVAARWAVAFAVYFLYRFHKIFVVR